MDQQNENFTGNSSSMFSNPWSQKQLRDFLYYCCAECNFKDQNQDLFIEHATFYHPQSREIFDLKSIKENENEHITEISQNFEDLNDDNSIENTETIDNPKQLYETISGKVGSYRFKCYNCDYKSKYKQAVIHHVERIHLKKRSYICQKCQKSFHQG